MLESSMLPLFASAAAILCAASCMIYLLWTEREKEIPFYALLAALGTAAAMECLALGSGLLPHRGVAWHRWSLLAEAFLPCAWLLYSLTFARARGAALPTPLSRILLLTAPLLPLAVLGQRADVYLRAAPGGRVVLLTFPGLLFYLVLVLYLTYALMQLERTLVLLPRHARWRVKFEILGAGTLLIVYLAQFSQGLLYRSFDAGFLPSRSFALIAATVLIAVSRARKGELVRIRVSRTVAFRSLAVIAVGVYLFGLGLLGQGLRSFPSDLQRALSMAAALAGGIGIVALFLSESLRRRMKVLLHTHFYKGKYDYRDHWLRFTRQIGAARSQEDLQQALLANFGETFAVEEAFLYLRDPEGEFFRPAAAHGGSLPDALFSHGNTLLRYFGTSDRVFASREENAAVWEENRPLFVERGVSFAIPLSFDRRLEGFILLGRPLNSSEDYTYEDFELMKVLAAQAAAALRSRRLTEELAATRELAAIGKISAFVLHDLKNLAASFALLADNAGQHLDDAEFRTDMLATIDGNVRRMRQIIARLQDLKEKPTLDLREGDLASVVRAVARQAGNREIEISGGPVPARFDPEEMRKVALNLLLNAREAAAEGPVRVEVGGEERVFLRVRDAGRGMSEEFIRRRLFRPFETTKKEGFGIGLYQSKHIVEAHGGTIEVRSAPGRGSEFTVWLPAGLNAADAGPS